LKQSRLIKTYFEVDDDHSCEGAETNTKNLSWDSRLSVRGLNSGPLQYKIEVLRTRTLCLVFQEILKVVMFRYKVTGFVGRKQGDRSLKLVDN
jgi:hypothetical protein